MKKREDWDNKEISEIRFRHGNKEFKKELIYQLHHQLSHLRDEVREWVEKDCEDALANAETQEEKDRITLEMKERINLIIEDLTSGVYSDVRAVLDGYDVLKEWIAEDLSNEVDREGVHRIVRKNEEKRKRMY